MPNRCDCSQIRHFAEGRQILRSARVSDFCKQPLLKNAVFHVERFAEQSHTAFRYACWVGAYADGR